MELQFMTPTMVWDSYDPKAAPLETSIISSQEQNNVVSTSVFFTAETKEDGKTRANAQIFYDRRWKDVRPALLFLRSLDPEEDFGYVPISMVKEGYVVCVLDYAAATDSGTSYPPSVGYAKYPECKSYLRKIERSAKETPWYEWTKLARRAISLLETQKQVDVSRIGIGGIGSGAQIAWQVAGTDDRIAALVTINGCGYLWRANYPKFTTDSVPNDDQERAFSSGVGAETYAHFVKCPTCCVVASNASVTDVDRAGDIVSLVQSPNKALIISRGTIDQLTATVYKSLLTWLRNNLAHTSAGVQNPTLSFECAEGMLYLRFNGQYNSKNRRISIAYGEAHSRYRYWTQLNGGQKVGEYEYIYPVPVYNANELIVAFGSICGKDGIELCTPVIGTVPSRIGATANMRPLESDRIFYTGKMGIGNFSASSHNVILNENSLETAVGPFDISGITVKEGALVFYKNNREKFSSARDAILQFDAYSAQTKDISLVITAQPNDKQYSATIKLKGGEFWQKVSLSATDFKSSEGRTLPVFADGKVFCFISAENVIFNNFLWI